MISVPGQNNMPAFGNDQMMVYNADRTVDGFIYSTEKGITITVKIKRDTQNIFCINPIKHYRGFVFFWEGGGGGRGERI